VGGGDEYKNSATAFEKLKLVEAGQRFANSATLTGTGDSGLYWSASVNGTNAARIRVDDGGVSFGANERARVDQCVASKTSNYTFLSSCPWAGSLYRWRVAIFFLKINVL
jgi:hypothetical protein